MTWEVYKQAIDWALRFARAGTQKEINLFGVGEPTLNPDLVEMVRYARTTLPFNQILHLNTNGNTMTERLARDLKAAGISEIDLTAHRARAAAKTIRIFRKVGIKGNLSLDFITAPNNWAGQVDWFDADRSLPVYQNNICPWLANGQVMVCSDGSVTSCCIDASNRNVFATVFDDLSRLENRAGGLCRTCHHIQPGKAELWRPDQKSRIIA
jgi:hypothetical protein